MNVRQALTELMYTLADVLKNGDLRGHFRAWWEAASGRITLDTRWGQYSS